MTTGVIVRRDLTFHFERSVDQATQVPEVMEVCVIPLASPSSTSPDATLVGGLQSQTVVLSQADNTAVFQLVPTDYPTLTAPVTYRAEWREGGIIGLTQSVDFSMPDADINFNDLTDLGAIIGGEVYLQQSDLGVPGRVAALNTEGQVVDSHGDPVAMPADVAAVQTNLDTAVTQLQQADTALESSVNTAITNQAQTTLTAAEAYTNAQLAPLSSALSGEAGARAAGDAALQTQISSLTTSSGSNTTALQHKADLDSNGYVPLTETNPAAITKWIQLPNQAAMLTLQYPGDVQPGDIVMLPDGTNWVLTNNSPSLIGSWYLLTPVQSVNGHTGPVVLHASDIGALDASASVPMTQVTGLSTALSNKAPSSVVGQVNSILNDTTYAHTDTTGLLPNALMPLNIALVTPAGEVTDKNGNVITSGSGAVESVNNKTGHVVLGPADVGAMAVGAQINQSQVTGLTGTFLGKLNTTDPSVTNARVPLQHATSHGATGSDPLSLNQSQIVGLSTTLNDYGNRIGSLETRVTTLETTGTGGTGPEGPAGTMVFWEAPGYTTNFSTVALHSPWGIDTTGTRTGTAGTKYNDPAGAASTDVAYPYITPNGHLQLRQWNESNPPDPAYALESELAAKANQTDLSATNSQIVSLTATVNTKANQSDLTNLTTSVSNCATQASLNATNATVATKANQTDLNTTNATVATKANQTDMTTAQTNITALQNQMPNKADLVTGKVPLNELPSLPISQTTGLATQLGAKADLTGPGNTVPLTEMPQNIPQAYIANLPATLSAKADLVGGVIPTSQIPAIAVTNTYVVANRAAMLALPAHTGDVCVISGTSDAGSYILQGSDPTQFSNWVLLTTGASGTVNSVNGYTGVVVLSWSDVGAMAASASIPISQITGLSTQLGTFATTSAMNTALAGKTAPTDVQNMLTASVEIKQRADYVATNPVASLSGQQSADGVIMPLGAVVLLTAQSSSITNGLWVVSAGAWTRPADFATGSYLVRGTLVMINNQTASNPGTNNNFTFWQETSASGVVDTNNNNWFNVMSAGPPVAYTAGNGLGLASQKFSAVAAPGGGCQVTTAGISVDTTSVCRKFLGAVPPGSNIVTITHNLNTTSVSATLIDIASGDLRLICPTVTGPNTISLEFNTPPATNQYRILVVG